jgi:hypothetical protein
MNLYKSLYPKGTVFKRRRVPVCSFGKRVFTLSLKPKPRLLRWRKAEKKP